MNITFLSKNETNASKICRLAKEMYEGECHTSVISYDLTVSYIDIQEKYSDGLDKLINDYNSIKGFW